MTEWTPAERKPPEGVTVLVVVNEGQRRVRTARWWPIDKCGEGGWDIDPRFSNDPAALDVTHWYWPRLPDGVAFDEGWA